MTSQVKEITRLMEERVPAPQILDLIFERYHSEMLDTERSLSLAIYEFYSLYPSVDGNTLLKQYEDSKMLWLRLMDYAIRMCAGQPVLQVLRKSLPWARKILFYLAVVAF